MRVLVVEDDQDIREAVCAGLTLDSINVDSAPDGDEALRLLELNDYDVAVLDRDVPGPSGDEIAQWIGEHGAGTRILMLTASGELSDKEDGFEAGADDYLTKPFVMKELILHVRALGRRAVRALPTVYESGGLRVDTHRHQVHRDGRQIALTPKQFAVLEVLAVEDGGVVTAEALLARAWDENANPFTNSVRITISALRKRLGEPWIIETIPGAGYRLRTRGPE